MAMFVVSHICFKIYQGIWEIHLLSTQMPSPPAEGQPLVLFAWLCICSAQEKYCWLVADAVATWGYLNNDRFDQLTAALFF